MRKVLIVGAGDAGEMVYRELSKPNVRDYHEGKQDWIEAGLPTET